MIVHRDPLPVPWFPCRRSRLLICDWPALVELELSEDPQRLCTQHTLSCRGARGTGAFWLQYVAWKGEARGI